MKTMTVILRWVARVSGLLLVLQGVAIWTGRADEVVPAHELFGFVLVLAVWALAFVGARVGISPGLVAVAVAAGLAAPILGLIQDKLLPGAFHWPVQIVHLAIGLSIIALAERMASGISGTQVAERDQ